MRNCLKYCLVDKAWPGCNLPFKFQAKILLIIMLVIHSCTVYGTEPSTQCCHKMKILATPHIGRKVGRRLVSSRAKCRAHASASYVGPCFPLPSVPQPNPAIQIDDNDDDLPSYASPPSHPPQKGDFSLFCGVWEGGEV